MDLTQITIVLPTKNESGNIRAFLDSLPAAVALIVVDAGSDDTRAIIATSRCGPTRIIADQGNIAAARQLGAMQAKTQWVLFTDADMIFDSDYFRRLEAIEPDQGVGAIIGAKLSQRRYRAYYKCFSLWLRVLCAVRLPAGSGSNLLVRRKVFQQVGGFDLQLSCNEDSELTWRIHRRGFGVRFEESLKVYENDHRRLDAGLFYKTLHSMLRCAWIFSGILGIAARRSDQGYWRRVANRHPT